MPTGLGLRPVAKAPDEPPNPTGYAPPLDSTPAEDDSTAGPAPEREPGFNEATGIPHGRASQGFLLVDKSKHVSAKAGYAARPPADPR